jgi:hypothetical protein
MLTLSSSVKSGTVTLCILFVRCVRHVRMLCYMYTSSCRSRGTHADALVSGNDVSPLSVTEPAVITSVAVPGCVNVRADVPSLEI